MKFTLIYLIVLIGIAAHAEPITFEAFHLIIRESTEIGIVEYKLFDLAIESIYQAYKGSHYSLFVDIFQVVL